MPWGDVATIGFYLLLAGFALYATCRDRDLIWVGAWLAVNCAASNALWLAGADVHTAAGIYSMLEFLVALSAFLAFGRIRSSALVGIVIFAGMSVIANIGICSIPLPNERQVFLWAVTTNACFALECLLAAGVGVADGYRTGRFAWRPGLHWRAAQSHASRTKPAGD